MGFALWDGKPMSWLYCHEIWTMWWDLPQVRYGGHVPGCSRPGKPWDVPGLCLFHIVHPARPQPSHPAPQNLAVIPLKSIPMSRHLPEVPAECQTLQIWLPLTTLTLRWHCAGFSCLFSWPWWHHRECSDPCRKKFESKIPSIFTDTIVTTRVAEDAVNTDILVNNGDTSISRAPCDAAFCKPLYKFSDSFALNSLRPSDVYMRRYSSHHWFR